MNFLETLSLDQSQCFVACDGETGPKGPKGEQGLIGPQGQKGESGEQGVQGEPGAIGAKGPSGPIGQPGLKGESGERGSPGLQGVQGEVGPPGAVGPAGPQGDIVKPPHCAFKTHLAHWENLSYLDEEDLSYEKTTVKYGKQVLLIKYITDIYQAKRICSALCGRVFLPRSSDENQQAATFISSHAVHGVWLRASDSLKERHWRDFETLEPLKFTKWGSGQPDNYDLTHGGEPYAKLRNDGTWNDIYYGGWQKVSILCELP